MLLGQVAVPSWSLVLSVAVLDLGSNSLPLERLSVDYGKKSKLWLHCLPFSQVSTSVAVPYNSVISTYSLLEHIDVVE